MTIYYVGSGGSDANAGTSWAARKLTLTGAEAVVAAGDTVYCAPGVYRETLTTVISGSGGNVITFIADISGAFTDGIGGIVRLTGSDNDQTATRSNCINCTHNYRTFQGFYVNAATSNVIAITSTNVIVQDCCVMGAASSGVQISGASQSTVTIRRCVFAFNKVNAILTTHTVNVDNAAHVFENCVVMNPGNTAIRFDRVGGVTIRNCTVSAQIGIRVQTALTVGQTITINNCILSGCVTALQATATAEMVENYNNFSNNNTDRNTVNTGANSNTYIAVFQPLLIGALFPVSWVFGQLSEWSSLRAIAGTGEASDDMTGITRPATSSKKSWGAIQFADVLRDTTTVYAGAASFKFTDAARYHLIVPTSAVATTISVRVRREANYAGTNPQLVIKQPGVSDTTVVDAGADSAWNLLTTTLTPAAQPGYIIVELVSNNTAASGSYAVYFDELSVN